MTKEDATDVVYRYICGCGAPELGLDALRVLCRHYDMDSPLRKGHDADAALRSLADGLKVELDGPGFWIILYLLDALDITEHGGGVRFGWLTEKGNQLKAALDAYTNEDFVV